MNQLNRYRVKIPVNGKDKLKERTVSFTNKDLEYLLDYYDIPYKKLDNTNNIISINEGEDIREQIKGYKQERERILNVIEEENIKLKEQLDDLIERIIEMCFDDDNEDIEDSELYNRLEANDFGFWKEVFCRKLVKYGYVELKDKTYILKEEK